MQSLIDTSFLSTYVDICRQISSLLSELAIVYDCEIRNFVINNCCLIYHFSLLFLFLCLADASCLCWTKNLVKLMTYKSSSAGGDYWFEHSIYGVGEARYLKRRITLKRCLKTYYICCPQNIICCSVLMSQYILTHFLRDTRIN